MVISHNENNARVFQNIATHGLKIAIFKMYTEKWSTYITRNIKQLLTVTIHYRGRVHALTDQGNKKGDLLKTKRVVITFLFFC